MVLILPEMAPWLCHHPLLEVYLDWTQGHSEEALEDGVCVASPGLCGGSQSSKESQPSQCVHTGLLSSML